MIGTRSSRRVAVLATILVGFSVANLAAQALPAAEAEAAERLAKSPRHAEWARIEAGAGDSFEAWIVYPERKDKAPVVIVIHEIFGLNDWARAVADQYAAEGFIAVAPDFLSGKAADGKGGSAVLGADGARAAISRLDPEEIYRRLDVAARWATALPSATEAYGAVGFCWGGGISFSWATRQPELGAAVVFYGTSPATATLASVKAPVLGLYGGADARVNATIPEALGELGRLGRRFDVAIYEGAGHAFLRQQAGQAGANMAASVAAWPRSVLFLRELLERRGSLAPDAGAALASLGAASEEDHCPPAEPFVTPASRSAPVTALAGASGIQP